MTDEYRVWRAHYRATHPEFAEQERLRLVAWMKSPEYITGKHARNHAYYAANREAIAAQKRTYAARKRPNYLGQEMRAAASREFERQICALRAHGLTFSEIGRQLGKSATGVRRAWRRCANSEATRPQ